MNNRNKVALVIGSGKKRIGNCIARALAEHGFDIALHYRSSRVDAEETAAELKRFNIASELFCADVSCEAEVNTLFSQVLERFSRLDLLVVAHGSWPAIKFENIKAEDVVSQFEINLLGTFLCCHRAGMLMTTQQEGGLIVTIGDWAVKRPYRDYAPYLISKGAIPTLTRTFAVELAAINPAVRVNCVLPGPVMVPEDLSELEKQEALEGTLLKRFGMPDHVAQAVIFFVDNDYTTGVCLPIDGGRTIA